MNPNWKQRKNKESGHVPWFAALWGVEGRVGAPKWDYEEWQTSTTHTDLHKTNTRWLVHNWSTFGARTSHGQIQTHKIHRDPDLGEATTFPPYSILCASSRGPHPNGILSRDSQVGSCQSWDSRNFGAS